MIRFVANITVFAITLGSASGALAGAVNFQEPADWTVGDVGSTFQQWEIPFLSTNSPPAASQSNPAVSTSADMSVQLPGFVAGSGGYYAFGGDYQILAEIFNHGGDSGSGGPYSSGFGTRVVVQTAASTNPDFDVSVFPNSIELVDLDGAPITGGMNDELLGVTELFRQEVETPRGPADQQELLFEFLLPNYTSDFQVRFLNSIHAGFFELRVDTLIVKKATKPGDFDGDGDVDSDDLGNWQAHYGVDARADADLDGDSDGADFLTWQRNYTGFDQPMVVAVPEPASVVVVIYAAMTLNLFTRPKRLAN